MNLATVNAAIEPLGWKMRLMTEAEIQERERVGAFSNVVVEKEGCTPLRYNFPDEGHVLFKECCDLVIDDVRRLETP